MRQIILASNNEHKINEFKEMFSDCEIYSLKDIWYLRDIDETGETFLDNALLKARAVQNFLVDRENVSIIADDSGLCVNALNWEPWVYSARYAWWHWDDQANRNKLLDKLNGCDDRSAYITCVLVELFPDWSYISVEWKTFWHILKEERWDKSFWYDCVFFSDDLNKSFWEVSNEEKNLVSHRWRAINMLKEKENLYSI